MAVEQKSCKWCSKPRAKYSCPKCRGPYCSLACYRDKRHEGCTESFYKDQVEESARAQQADDETKREMLRIVQRYRDSVDQDAADMAGGRDGADSSNSGSDSESDDAEPSLAERLDGIDIHAELDDGTAMAVWSRLTKDERKEFTDLICGQGVEAIINPWRPWWCTEGSPAIADADESAESGGSSNVPRVLKIGAPVQSLTRRVHPSVLFQLAQLSLAYVYTMRHLNGDARGCNLAAAFDSLEAVSPLLSDKVAEVYQSVHEAVAVGFSGIGEGLGGEAKCTLLDDILAIYSTPTHVAAMVSDIYGIVTELIGTSAGRPKRARVLRAEKRLVFLASVVQQMQGAEDPWQFMAADIAMLKRRYATEAQMVNGSTALAPQQDDRVHSPADARRTEPKIQPL
ncbi:Zinc finger HIT domain-containing protein 2 [Coemansia javaensis]|uniref:Zinc finger HIT domain-containing protein 2 n=1 Tax=Coemansia javaensis TaxID=2761396 RepID=A0A9W8HFJ8_9FUNG|nr:Zinc finger HIT domain-containing protein 2 [Coemansia javaensis]